jgi:hypothetical protein
LSVVSAVLRIEWNARCISDASYVIRSGPVKVAPP